MKMRLAWLENVFRLSSSNIAAIRSYREEITNKPSIIINRMNRNTFYAIELKLEFKFTVLD